MSLPTDEILPEEPNGELVHWMEPAHARLGPAVGPAAAGFLLGVAAAVGGFLLWRYLAPKRPIPPPWRWGRGPLH
jgi:hypothetical protein